MHYLASVSGHEHFLAKDPLPSGHKLHLANVPGYEHLLAKDPLPPPHTSHPQALAHLDLTARGMQSIFELPSCLCMFLADTCMYRGPLVALPWISGDVSSGF